MSGYFEHLTAHYRDVRARLDGRPTAPWVQPQPQAPAPTPAPLPERVLEPGIEPDLTPRPFSDWISPLPSELVQIHPLAGAACSLETKDAIADVLRRHHGVFRSLTWEQVIAKDNSRERVNARAEIYALLRERGWSYPQIGRLVGGRDHTTIINSVQRYHARKVTK
jgi:hypothetical protein